MISQPGCVMAAAQCVLKWPVKAAVDAYLFHCALLCPRYAFPSLS